MSSLFPPMLPHWLLHPEPSRRTLESTDLPPLRSTCYCQQMRAVESEENAEFRLLQKREDMVRTTTHTVRTSARCPQPLTPPPLLPSACPLCTCRRCLYQIRITINANHKRDQFRLQLEYLTTTRLPEVLS